MAYCRRCVVCPAVALWGKHSTARVSLNLVQTTLSREVMPLTIYLLSEEVFVCSLFDCSKVSAKECTICLCCIY